MRVLVIEPDSVTATSLELMLKSEGFTVYTTDLGEEACDLLSIYDYDAIISEIDLTDISGLTVLRTLRKGNINTPVVYLTGVSNHDTQIEAINAGADDYITKPFHKDNLIARLRAIVRRAAGHSTSVISMRGVTLDLSNKFVWVDGERVHFTTKEYDLLELLMLHKERIFSKDVILDHIYGGRDEPELKIIDVFICKIRNRLSDVGIRDLIETVWGRGYRATENTKRVKAETWQRGESLKHLGRRQQLMRILQDVPPIAFEPLRERMDLNPNAMRIVMSNAIRDGHARSQGDRDCRAYTITDAGRAAYSKFLEDRGLTHETVAVE